MKKVFIPFCFVAMAAFACGASPIGLSELPSSAQIFLKEFFSDFEVVSITSDDSEYEVVLKNGIKIEFDKRGRWKTIQSSISVPVEILPVLARDYLSTNYPSQVVIEIDREGTGYEAELKNGIEINFAQDGTFLAVDK